MAGMGMRVDEARHHDHAARVDALGLGRGVENTVADGGYPAVFHQYIARVEDAPIGIHGDDRAILDQQGFRHRSRLPS